MQMKKRYNKGITLIALVITIIVLLILAGISIASLTGENGILKEKEVMIARIFMGHPSVMYGILVMQIN